MRILLLICLFAFFGYALGLVISNNNEIAVNLLFSQAPAMNLGLLLIICIFLGVLIGLILSLLMFKVLQNKWELSRLKKENNKLKGKLEKATEEIEKTKAISMNTTTEIADETLDKLVEESGSNI